MGSSDSRLADTVAYRALSSSSSSSSSSVSGSGSPRSLSGKVALITGPTSGIGYETARVLASNGCHVVLAARDKNKLSKVKQQLNDEIKKEKGEAFNPMFSEINIDLGSLESVRNAVNEFISLGLPIHYLIANAGIFTGSAKAMTTDGFEAQVGTNHLGHYYFIKLLLPKIRSSATPEDPSRIVLVSSRAHKRAPLNNFSDIEASFTSPSTSIWSGYGNSKLFNLYHAKHLASTEKCHGILAFSLHPGIVSTDIGRDTRLGRFFFNTIGSFILKNANQGASTTIYCTLAAPAEQSGGYFADNSLTEEAPIGKNDSFQQKVIELSEKFITEWGKSASINIGQQLMIRNDCLCVRYRYRCFL